MNLHCYRTIGTWLKDITKRHRQKMLLFGVLKDITTEKLESRPEHYMAIIGVISFIILGKT